MIDSIIYREEDENGNETLIYLSDLYPYDNYIGEELEDGSIKLYK